MAAQKVKHVQKKAQSFKSKKKQAEDSSADAVTSRRMEAIADAPKIDLREFQPELLDNSVQREVMRLPEEIVKRIGGINGLPKDLGKDLRTTYNSALMVRKETLDLLQLTEAAAKESATDEQSKHLRIVLGGESGVGKSATLLQAVSHCLSTEWFVLYVPNAIQWVDGRHPYAPVSDGANEYTQAKLTQSVLAGVKQMNAEALTKLHTTRDHAIGATLLPKGASLEQLVDAGIANGAAANGVWQALIDELVTTKELPVLVAVDGLNAFYTPADYHHPDSTQVMPKQLQLVKPLVELFEGQRVLQHGIAIGALSFRDARYGKQHPTPTGKSRLLQMPISRLGASQFPIDPALPDWLAQTRSLEFAEVNQQGKGHIVRVGDDLARYVARSLKCLGKSRPKLELADTLGKQTQRTNTAETSVLQRQAADPYVMLAPVLQLAMETLYLIHSSAYLWTEHSRQLVHSAAALCAISYWLEQRCLGASTQFSTFARDLRAVSSLLWAQYLSEK
ncbi:mitochondrial ribosomal death-associated protein 3-domain-containing protein [Thamnocephalis sphaerospora]|uniref:Small ribosomal subunit protein mS29 n=1 Tax=Thamnocephalis sphaerospora TaxID=78915 RepID=A0A4P9XKV0_9FUNG|nr:mitochondrial ribosomal death-associated protein 3-domain-containing protein [Thamnocephalis sphaerospora]|eukprot:RKP06395.1 mitochondrial ribosomal death-associated protein 3-domain-containing protein [Thamnocephalis sphaerospora]